METVLSGIRSTGNLHLGNYFGAVKNFVKMQHEYNCYFFIADLHSLTTHPKPDNLHDNIKKVLSEYIACGIDPEVATIYIQSDVPEISELYLLLNMNTYIGELERTTTFKEKIRKQPENVNAGLLTYPVLMCADIIIHNADKVPVGKDQEQNLEMARKFAKRFNHMYDVEYFTLPEPFNFGSDLVKVPGLDGTGKMGKSDNNGIYLIDEPGVIKKKVMRAVTDSGPTTPNSEMPEAIQNLFYLMDLMSEQSTIEHFKSAYNDCTIRYGDLKKQLTEDTIKFTTPFREKILDIYNDSDYLAKVVKRGAEQARESASKTLREVREILGYKPF
jgi:tryptophanyl-tRNA synthetase